MTYFLRCPINVFRHLMDLNSQQATPLRLSDGYLMVLYWYQVPFIKFLCHLMVLLWFYGTPIRFSKIRHLFRHYLDLLTKIFIKSFENYSAYFHKMSSTLQHKILSITSNNTQHYFKDAQYLFKNSPVILTVKNNYISLNNSSM